MWNKKIYMGTLVISLCTPIILTGCVDLALTSALPPCSSIAGVPVVPYSNCHGDPRDLLALGGERKAPAKSSPLILKVLSKIKVQFIPTTLN